MASGGAACAMPEAAGTFRREMDALTILDWAKPIAPQAAAWLARGWDGATALDLSGTVVIVPTRQAGRRLRAALAVLAEARGRAVFSPLVATAESFLGRLAAAPEVADPLLRRLSWIRALMTAPDRVLAVLFPDPTTVRGPAAAHAAARRFLSVESLLSEGGLAMADVASAAGDAFPEQERWQALGALEREADSWLEACGRKSEVAVRRAVSSSGRVPAGVERVVLVATPDPHPLLLAWLESVGTTLRVEVVAFGPDAADFDRWGRPLEERWKRADAGVADDAIHVCPDPDASAALVADLAGRLRRSGSIGSFAVGVGAPEHAPRVVRALEAGGVTAHDPEGLPLSATPLGQAARRLLAVARDDSPGPVLELARLPASLALSAPAAAPALRGLLQGLDHATSKALPADRSALVEAVRRLCAPEVAGWVGSVGSLAARLSGGEGMAALREALAAVSEALQAADPEGSTVEDATALAEVLGATEAALRHDPSADPALWAVLLESSLGEVAADRPPPPHARPVLGWLELLWEPSPQVVVVGLEEGSVPESVLGDAFLPEGLRARLGLRTNAAREARDAYLLAAVTAARRDRGRLDVVISRTSADGEPRRPSRLLLRGDDRAFLVRLRRLFRDPPPPSAAPAWQRAWRLSLPAIPPIDRISPTGIRAYLECPFRFLLARILRMEPFEPDPGELDPREYGSVCHAVLQAMAVDPSAAEVRDPDLLAAFAERRLAAILRERYGENPPFAVELQAETLVQRLRAAAGVEARDRADGWVTRAAEIPLDRLGEFVLGGLRITGTVDRIDEHPATGRWRIVDYKTAARPSLVGEAHLKPVRGAVAVPPWRRHELGGKAAVWVDVQLPLYAWAFRRARGVIPEVGYFQIPDSVADVRYTPWAEFSEADADAAAACAAGVANAVLRGEFWPPAEDTRGDDAYAGRLFFRGTADSIDLGAYRAAGGHVPDSGEEHASP